jgi:DNA-binding response OmpR family regulator
MSETKCRILVVEDNVDSSEILGMLFSDSNYEVHTAPTMEEALRLATSQEFDLYVLDKRLPDGSGLELCKRLTVLTPNVPCIFYSGDAYEIHRQEAYRAGADVYVAKPDIDSLIAGVQSLLSNSECASPA